MSSDPGRRLAAAAFALLLIAAVAGCTHFTPYYRADQLRQVAAPEAARIDHRLLLIGDAGDAATGREPALELLGQRVRMLPERTTVVFLGDNVYEQGMPRPLEPGEAVKDKAAQVADVVVADVFDSREQAERCMNAQIDTVRGTPARAIFIPGNHDWDQFEEGGWDRILSLEDFIRNTAAQGNADVALLPPGGCPGPNALRLGNRGELIVIDTQWWLETRTDGKPTPENNPTKCPHTTEKAIREAIVGELEAARAEKRWSIVVGHHPMASNGPHGGFDDLRAHLFPLQIIRHYVPFYLTWIPVPVVGSLLVWARQCCSTSPQDFSNGRNLHLRNSVGHAMVQAEERQAAPLAYAAGHDHSLQVFESKRGPRVTLVSGLGSSHRASAVSDDARTLFAHSNPARPGLMQIDFLDDGSVRLAVIEYAADEATGTEMYSRLLSDGSGESAPSSVGAEASSSSRR